MSFLKRLLRIASLTLRNLLPSFLWILSPPESESAITMAPNPLECDICCNTYNDDHYPRILPCTHVFCGRCITELISTQKMRCPSCRVKFTANSAEDLMINRDILDVAKQLASKHVGSKITSTRPKKPFLKTSQDSRENVITCQEMEAEVKDRIKSSNKMRKGLEGFMQTLEEVKLSSKETWSNIARDNKLLMDKLDIIKGKLQTMKDLEDKLEAATDFASGESPMDEAEKVFHEVDETANEIKQLFQEDKHNIKQDSLKMKINLENALEVIGRMIEEEEEQQEQEQETEQEQEEGEQEEERDSIMKITVTDLRSPRGHLRGDTQREIFVVMTIKGKLRMAPVKIESNNQLYINHLEEGRLPPGCFVIELESLMQGSPSPSPYSPPRAFLDLTYESTHLGRVIVRVTENGMKGLNFLYMCAGGMGPSYANSQVLGVKNKGEAGEHIDMGKYVSHGGGGGGGKSTEAVLSSGEDWQREMKSEIYKWTPWKAGDVRGIISYKRASRFWIVTRDCHSWRRRDCFGMVEEGLEVLKDAISKYPDIKKVKVATCGLIL
ncbi:LOW QUALITY PROTEIN: tripartite motif-containing protein 59-like [Macrobrachium rosenbergii]|uniref:LOW QUALITY PROTEIN: tripartite motif-containing protein 59-like n=1 Tax=Macrobrachium rosenbergii TaxID=79674 RepID=UPI0034D7402B